MNISLLNRAAAPNWSSLHTKSQKSCNVGTTFSDKMDSAAKDKQVKTASAIGMPAASGYLTDDDYRYLSSKFDPTNMSQDDYDAFLDYLLDKNIIVEEDKGYLGYGGDMISPPDGLMYYTPSLEPPVLDYKDGNVLAFTRYRSSLCSEQPNDWFNRSKRLFTKITTIFERMMENRD